MTATIFLLWGCGWFLLGIFLESAIVKYKLRTKLRKALKEVHGGGNGRRLLEQILEDI